MKLENLGEFGLIRRFAPRFTKNLPSSITGIGDDCAIIPYNDTHAHLVTTDLLIENVHFLPAKISAQDLGYKSLAVNLSDIAGMGGKPLYAFLSLGLPSDTEVEWIDAFFDGVEMLSKQEGVLLLGGDTTASPHLVINFLVQGEIPLSCIKKRSAAKTGDVICCTGNLGDSGGGLKALLDMLPLIPCVQTLVDRHHHPLCYLKQSQWLAKHSCVHAMMDISDGIDADLRHILEQSHCGASIEVESLPLSKELQEAAARFDWSLLSLALSAGEDYCLLLTVDPEHYATLSQDYKSLFGQPLYKIGTLTSQVSQLHYYKNGKSIEQTSGGFDHFKK